MMNKSYLQAKENNGGDTHPAVQAVHIVDGLRGEVVGVEDGLQTHASKQQSAGLQTRVQDLHKDLTVVPEHPVHQHR